MRVNDAPGESFQLYLDMAYGPDRTLHVVWEDFRNGEYLHGGDIYHANSSDGGQTWSADERVNDDGHVFVIWADERNDLDNCYTGCSSAHHEFDIYGTQSSNGGFSWP